MRPSKLVSLRRPAGWNPQLQARIVAQLTNCTLSQLSSTKLAENLQREYPEYARKRQRGFHTSVCKACRYIGPDLARRISIVQQERRKRRRRVSRSEPSSQVASDAEQQLPSDDDSFSSDNPNLVDYSDTNLVNASLSALYRSPVQEDRAEGNDDVGAKAGNCVGSSTSRGTTKPTSGSSLRLSEKKSKLPVTGSKMNKAVDFLLEVPKETFADIGGCEKQLLEACNFISHLKRPDIYVHLSVTPPCGFLVHGPPGCGKSLFAKVIAGEFSIPMLKLAATELISGVSGESEEKIRDLFDHVQANSPCILFIDEIDAITPKRETAQREMEKRIVSQLISCLDELSSRPSTQVLVIGATSRPDSLEPALRRAGRFDKEIAMGIPDINGREKILGVLCRHLQLSIAFDYRGIARNTPGYVGADLAALTREACMCAVDRVCRTIQQSDQEGTPEAPAGSSTGHRSDADELEKVKQWLKSDPSVTKQELPEEICIEMDDFEKALKSITPSAKREGFATVPDVKWDHIGALSDVREDLKWSILLPIRYPDSFEELGLNSRPQGILLCGPPGCGKTLLAKAIANETGMNFISIKGPELLSMYVGESERAVRQVFQRARNSAPCVIFFDELDSIVPKRVEGDSGSSVRVVNQMLTEMDGMEARKQVFLIGATNRPDIIDPAIMRPGRLDKVVYVGFPNATDRADILRAITAGGTRPKLASDVSLDEIACDDRCACFSGADMAALVREASVIALKERMSAASLDIFGISRPGIDESSGSAPELPTSVARRHFDEAFIRIQPSVSETERKRYETIKQKHSRSHK